VSLVTFDNFPSRSTYLGSFDVNHNVCMITIMGTPFARTGPETGDRVISEPSQDL